MTMGVPANGDAPTLRPPEGRDAAGRFRPGRSGNPGGRRRTLVETIRLRTRDGNVLVRELVCIVRNPDEATRDRIAASRILLEWGFARPQIAVETTGRLIPGCDCPVTAGEVCVHMLQAWLGNTSEQARNR